MPDGASVLARKIRPRTPSPAAMTEMRALTLAVAQAAEAMLGVSVRAEDLQTDELTGDEIAARLPDPGLMMRLEGPMGRTGICALCAEGLSAVSEAATLGRVSPEVTSPRRGTATDGILAQGFIDRIFTGLAPRLGQLDDPPPFGGFAWNGVFPGAHGAALSLADGPHVLWQCRLVFGEAARAAQMTLVVPRVQLQGARIGDIRDWAQKWRPQILSAEACITAELATLTWPAGGLSDLEPGQVIELPRARLDRITLRAPGRMRVGHARLGRIGGLRAVRIADLEKVRTPEDIDGHAGPAMQGVADRAGAP